MTDDILVPLAPDEEDEYVQVENDDSCGVSDGEPESAKKLNAKKPKGLIIANDMADM